ncbi:MAG: hypothetical protein ACI9Y1_001831, partial [Lentisphaeria bacterium]
MSEFDQLRPYNDAEVKPIIAKLLEDAEFLDVVFKLKMGRAAQLLAPVLGPFARAMVRRGLKKQVAAIATVRDLQKLLERYLGDAIDNTVDALTVSGLEQLNSEHAYLFISNHRDIAMDPAFLNWTLYHNGFGTLRIAIGDNLLTKPYSSHLMRLNKCFIVNRSATAPREKLRAAKLLSKYIHHSVVEDNENVWIAQREGRAKDGIDRTNGAIVSMLAMNRDKTKSFADYIRKARIVPVSISYEYDPCDYSKAREILKKATQGSYIKTEHEDVQSIVTGIGGYKGRVHLSFGAALTGEYEDSEAVKDALDFVICNNYKLHVTNCFAYEFLEGVQPEIEVGENAELFSSLLVKNEAQMIIERQ